MNETSLRPALIDAVPGDRGWRVALAATSALGALAAVVSILLLHLVAGAGITDTPLALTWQITALVTAGLLCLIGVTTLLGEHNSRLDRVGALAARLAAAAISAVSVWTVATEFSSSGSAVTAVACVALPAATWLWWIASTLSRGHDRHSDVADDPHSH